MSGRLAVDTNAVIAYREGIVAFKSGLGDFSSRHNDYLAEALDR